jgi:hypothetical protein
MFLNRLAVPTLLSCAFVLFAAPYVSAQTDEIQVYDGGLTDIRKFNCTTG